MSDKKDWSKVAKKGPAPADDPDKADAAEDAEVEPKKSQDDDLQGILTHPSYKALEDQLTEAEQKAHDNWDKAVRSASELENVKRRAERDVEKAHKFATQKLIHDCLPVLDSLDQALTSHQDEGEQVQTVMQGVELTRKMFEDVLVKHGVAVINPQGEAFDPELHEAMSMQASDEAPDNTVLVVFQKGYQLNGRLIRPARVVVATGGAKKS